LASNSTDELPRGRHHVTPRVGIPNQPPYVFSELPDIVLICEQPCALRGYHIGNITVVGADDRHAGGGHLDVLDLIAPWQDKLSRQCCGELLDLAVTIPRNSFVNVGCNIIIRTT